VVVHDGGGSRSADKQGCEEAENKLYSKEGYWSFMKYFGSLGVSIDSIKIS
jgi:hypothetical protein